MKKIIIFMGSVFLALSLFAKVEKIVDEQGNVYEVYLPDITRPTIVLPDITKLSIEEVKSLPLDIKYAIIKKLSIQQLSLIEPTKLAIIITSLTLQQIETIQPEKLAIIIIKLEKRDLDIVLKEIMPAGIWYKEQVEFYEMWKKKDVKGLTKLIEKVLQPEFILAWGNYLNYDKIDWNKKEDGFIRQVLVSQISYNWEENFKPNQDIILTIDFGLDNAEIKALLDLIQKNKDKIKLIILPWGKSKVNNFDNYDFSTYPEVAEWCDKLFYSIKEVAPEIPVYLTVCMVSSTMDAWIKSFKAPYQGVALWNILNTDKANLDKVYDIVSKYNKNIILSGVFQCNPDGKWIDFQEAKKITLNTIDRVKKIGFKGVILMTNRTD